MKIIYYSSLPFSDCDFPLVKAWQEAGHDVRYYIPLRCDRPDGPLTSIRKPDPRSAIIPAISFPELAAFGEYMDLSGTMVVNRTRKGGHPRNLLLYLKLLREWRRLKADVIHVTFPLCGPEILLYPLRKKMVLTVHDPFLHSGEESGKKERQRKAAFRLTPRLVLLNAAQKEAFLAYYRLGDKPILENRLGPYDCLRYHPSPAPAVQGRYILFFGRFSPYKGIEYLCEAMKTVHETDPDLKCVIAGSGKLYFDWAPWQDAPYLKLISRYINSPELSGFISGALFCVCPYTDATQSGVVYSAFALDCPVVASDVGGLRETVLDSRTGLLVKEKDPQALAKAILRLSSDSGLLQRCREGIHDLYSGDGELGWKAIARKYIDFYAGNNG